VLAKLPRNPVGHAAAWLMRTDWPLLVMIVLIYSQFPDDLRLFDARPLAALVAATLVLRAAVEKRSYASLLPAVAALFLYCVVALSSYLWAEDKVPAAAAGVRLAKDAILFVLVAASLDSAVRVRRAAWAVVAAGLLMTVVPVYQWLSGNYQDDFHGFGNAYIAHIWGEVDGWRVAGTLTDANSFAQAILPVFALAFGLLWVERRWLARVVAAVALATTLLATILSYSRGGALTLGIVVILLLVAFRPRRRVAAILLALAVVAWPAVDAGYINRAATIAQFAPGRQAELLKEPGFHGRVSELLSAVQMFRDRPLFGVGLGNYEFHYQRYAGPLGIDKRSEDREAHNLALEIAAETGVAGLATFGAFMLTVLVAVPSARRRALPHDRAFADLVSAAGIALLAYLAMSMTLHDGYSRFLWIVAGIAYGSLFAVRSRPRLGAPGADGTAR